MIKAVIKRYGAYKDSGVEWLGEVPEDWELKRLKELTTIQNSNVDKKSHENELSVKLCNYVDVYKNEFIDSSLDFMQATADESEIKRFTIKKSDVLITKDSETCDDIAVPALATQTFEGVVCGYHLAQFRTKEKMLLGSYLFRLFQSKSYGFRFVISAKGITRVGLGQSAIADSLTPVPPLPEQKAIADYLYTKTAHIDRKIDLLSQKATQYGKLKQSLINETVTRGLDKTVAMKDSGVEWIGEVPEHWEVKRVKELGNLVLGKMLDNVKSENTFYRSYLKSKNIGWLKVEDTNIEKMYFSLAEMKNYRLKKDDILLSEGGEVGKTSFWNDEIEECYIQNSVHKITVYKNNSPRFFLYQSFLLGSIKYYDSIVSHVSIKHLTKEKLSRVNWVRPPLAEQKTIADYLDTKIAHIDRIVETITIQIDKLKELRKTLINDVVTGKIKVVK